MLGTRLKCPKCDSMVGYHVAGLNFVLYRFQKCPSCGRWAFMRYISKTEVEEKEKTTIKSEGEKPSEEELRKRIEESKYEEA